MSHLPRRRLPFLLGTADRPSAAARWPDAAASVARCSLPSVAPRCAGGAAGAMRGVRRPPMPGVGGLPMPAVLSDEDDCPFPSRATQLGTIGALRMRVGLRPDELDGSCRPLLVKRARTRRVRGGRLRDSSEEGEEEENEDGGPGGEGLGGSGAGCGGGGGSDGHPSGEDDDAVGGHVVSGNGGAAADDGDGHASPSPPPTAQHPKRLRLGTPRAKGRGRGGGTIAERAEVLHGEICVSLKVVLGACLRLAAGMPTRTADFSRPGVSGCLVGASSSPSRAVFCRFGPSLVDVAALWFSPAGKVLCSCRSHKQNVALAAVSGGEVSCWHADCFRDAMKDVDAAVVTPILQVQGSTEPHAITFNVKDTRCALAYDGAIFCPVVATERRQIKCIGVGCRSMERTCTHARLTRALPVFSPVVGGEGGDNLSDAYSEDVDDQQRPKASADFGEYGHSETDVAEIMRCMKGRAKRNLLPCQEEEKQGGMWLRTADLLDTYASAANQSASVVPQCAELPVPLKALVQGGLCYDTRKPLVESKCASCGAEKLDDEAAELVPAILYTHHATAKPLQVSGSLWMFLGHLFLLGAIISLFLAHSTTRWQTT